MSKQILIIGGGISGLSLLHYLKIKYYFVPDVKILLLEENDILGGTIQSVRQGDCLFESGPNGFLNAKPRTLHLINELGLDQELISASEQANLRFVSIKNKLIPVPMKPQAFLKSNILGPFSKMRLFFEPFIPKGKDPNETIAAFGQRRFGRKATERLLDSVVTGIFAGDIKKLILREAFPKIYEMEQTSGSILKAMVKNKKLSRKSGHNANKEKLMSFRNGMSTITTALASKHRDHIRSGEHVLSVSVRDKRYFIHSHREEYQADQVFLCTPAYASARLMEALDQNLFEQLNTIVYAPVAVVGLAFNRQNLNKFPEGFGYLIPSSQKNPVLGVLFENNIFPGRCGENKVLFRVMLGGSHFPNILEKSKEELINTAIREIHKHFPISAKPDDIFYTSWPKAIPQYDQTYVTAKAKIQSQLDKFKDLHLVANYLNGISFNDCIENAYAAAQTSRILADKS